MHDLSRQAGLARLQEFVPQMGRAYAAGRNADPGPDAAPVTSALSPYLRRRLVLEQEVVEAAIAAHGTAQAEKFVQEVFWRTYFKGHLQTHPALWTNYRAQLARDHARLAAESGLRRAWESATGGRTGIACLDDWSRELVEFNWLHNHTRMWFASIWIFTLGLPWALGADFFLRHLVDGDPASNTLSWRWVAGLHTKGRAYAARADNIARYTNGRYHPTGLNERPEALTEDDAAPLEALAPTGPQPDADVALLLHLDDLHPESLDFGAGRVVRVAGLLAHAPDAGETVCAADRAAMDDALRRAAAHWGCEAALAEEGWHGGLPVVAAEAPVGPSADALPPCHRVRRAWDTEAWPRTTKGYFALKAAIPKLLAASDA